MPTDEKSYLKSEIARMKEAVRNSEALQVELKELVATSRKFKKSRQDELTRQQTTTQNLKFHIKDLEETLKKLP